MPDLNTETVIRTMDGLNLRGTVTAPPAPVEQAVVLVHGGGVTREEGGFFGRMAGGLAEAGVATLRYDLRGHGESDGRPEESSLAAHLNDIRVARDHLREVSGAQVVNLLGTSFGGGLAAYYAAKRPEGLTRLVLLNPQLNYKDRYIDQKPYWAGDFLDATKAQELADCGFIDHSPTVQHSRAFLNEVFWIRPNVVLGEITAPTLIVHGTKDTFVPVEASRAAVREFRAEHRLVEIKGAQHGFAVHEDPEYRDPQTQEWQAFVIRTVAEWFTETP
ncbi:alpha/beta fold hydrolase [Actinosynnema sp. NPDC023587]|uniref:alpha/beta hydrolase n=1 Tax=Actinosynnema sp. NPDC023587 TaxID=3154695 RepID=UPI0033CFC45A